MPLVRQLHEANFAVQLKHIATETSSADPKNGFVRILNSEGTVTIVEIDDFQHNRNYGSLTSRSKDVSERVASFLATTESTDFKTEEADASLSSSE